MVRRSKITSDTLIEPQFTKRAVLNLIEQSGLHFHNKSVLVGAFGWPENHDFYDWEVFVGPADEDDLSYRVNSAENKVSGFTTLLPFATSKYGLMVAKMPGLKIERFRGDFVDRISLVRLFHEKENLPPLTVLVQDESGFTSAYASGKQSFEIVHGFHTVVSYKRVPSPLVPKNGKLLDYFLVDYAVDNDIVDAGAKYRASGGSGKKLR